MFQLLGETIKQHLDFNGSPIDMVYDRTLALSNSCNRPHLVEQCLAVVVMFQLHYRIPFLYLIECYIVSIQLNYNILFQHVTFIWLAINRIWKPNDNDKNIRRTTSQKLAIVMEEPKAL